MIIGLIHIILGLIAGIAFLGAILTRQNYLYVRRKQTKKQIVIAAILNLLTVLSAMGILILVMRGVKSFTPIEWSNLIILLIAFSATLILGWRYFIKPK